MDSPSRSPASEAMNEREMHLGPADVGKAADGMGLRRALQGHPHRIPTSTDAFQQIQAIQRQMLEDQSLSGTGSDSHGMASGDLVQGEVMGVMGAEQQRIVAEIMQSTSSAGLVKTSYYSGGGSGAGSAGGGDRVTVPVTDGSLGGMVPVSSQQYIPTAGGEDRQTYELAEQLLSHQLNPELFGGGGGGGGTAGGGGGSTGLSTGHHHDLTEEDRRLVSALVAVQMAQQQKHQHISSGEVVSQPPSTTSPNPVLTSANSSMHTTTTISLSKQQYLMHKGMHSPPPQPPPPITTASSVMYPPVTMTMPQISNGAQNRTHSPQDEDDTLANLPMSPVIAPTVSVLPQHHHHHHVQQQQPPVKIELPLPPLKKVLSNQSLAMSRLLSGKKDYGVEHQLPIMAGLSDNEMDADDVQDDEEDDKKAVKEEPAEEIETEDKDFLLDNQSEDGEKEGEESEPGEEEEEEEQEEEEEEDDDEDEEEESQTKPSRRTLPHKKRIPRKLKQPKKSSTSSSASRIHIHSKCYKCNKCGEQFPSQQAYSAHKQEHVRKLFTCEICSKGFAQQLRFFEHLKAHYEAGLEADLDEDRPVSMLAQQQQKQPLSSHQASSAQKSSPASSSKPALHCEKCDKTFRREKAYETHMISFHSRQESPPPPPPPLPPPPPQTSSANSGVETGSRRVSRQKRITVHKLEPEELDLEPDFAEDPLAERGGGVQVEEEEETHTCEVCSADFSTKGKLASHMRKTHAEPRKRKKAGGKKEILTCPKCGRVFNHRNSLVYHLRSHTGERPHQCEMCGKSFFASSALKVHMRLHSGEKPYKCEYCGRHFRQWGDLKYHCISIHTDERQYQCEFCGKDFARKYSLIVHRRIHTGERNYKCEFCGKCFRAASYLQNHRRIHTGEKPHPCSICGKPFRVRSDMKRHMQTHNRESGQSAAQARSLVSMAAASVAAVSAASSSGATHIGLGQSHTPVSQHDLVSVSAAAAAPQITIEESSEAIITGDALSQPVSLSITVPQRALEGHHHAAGTTQQLQQQGVQEEVLGYTRDPMDSVTIRENSSGTLYVWPVFMN